MKEIGLFYGSTYGMTETVARKIQSAFRKFRVMLHNVKDASADLPEKYDFLLFGTSAWGIGEMQSDWENWVFSLGKMDFSGKKVALFGLGDQKKFPDSFADGLGKLYSHLPDKSVVVGEWPLDGYSYHASLAEKNGRFVGLVLDENNQKDRTDERIRRWVDQLEKEFSD
ncbi:flavodoxin [Candidatus Sulfidibacterium hydrothermale]|uniref:flavodoxin n=1 Tax=Candidatus Sulfidibacterium hydrothermale TaxID=2875962 RepID=UPI001F0AF365|nr:flavodoxin [Candidatus Sulfidibacterium hydrothermale]UBM62970.1 flavodoxin [Candidatus Sulfidibacterium hydrothermale]